ncbi:MAG: 2-amino-4-hydroxy-6-hydroxymethyldihydropteridine diphosphokinase [bacterium]
MADLFQETVILSLGSNLGDSKINILKAISLLKEKGFSVSDISSFYKTSPVGKTDQPDFINCAIIGSTLLLPHELLAVCKEIETILGRDQKSPHWSARIIDIDIIFFGCRKIKSPDLTVPHPMFAGRLFVLMPVAEIAPDFALPDGVRFADFWDSIRASEIFSNQIIEII